MKETFSGRRIFLLIGVNDFADERFPNLKFAGNDVTAMKDFLASNNNNRNDVFIELLDKDATTENILKALNQIESLNRSSQDTIIIYISSHGSLDYTSPSELERFVVAHNSDFSKVGRTALPVSFLEQRMIRLPSQKKAMILALCHSGGGKSKLPLKLVEESKHLKGQSFPKPLQEASKAFMILSASSWHEAAREDSRLRQDIYTHYLLEGLNRNDTNGDGVISLFEAHEHARSRTYDHTQGRQTPSIVANISGVDPIILKGQKVKTGSPMIYADEDPWRRWQLKVDGKSAGSFWQAKAVPTGTIHLEIYDPEKPQTPIVDHEVILDAGNSYPLSRLLTHRPRVDSPALLSFSYNEQNRSNRGF